MFNSEYAKLYFMNLVIGQFHLGGNSFKHILPALGKGSNRESGVGGAR